MPPSKVITIDNEKYYEYEVLVSEYKTKHLVKIDSNEHIVIKEAIAEAVISSKIPIIITKVSHN